MVRKFRSNYLDVDNDALYPFGYGLSYTTFQYGDIVLNTPTMKQNETITATIQVTNSGKYDGAEVVQLYIRDLVGSITRPVRELKGFKKYSSKREKVRLFLSKLQLICSDSMTMTWKQVTEPGEFDIFIGGSSQATKTARLTLK